MGHEEPYYPEEIRAKHKCFGCEQLQAQLAAAHTQRADDINLVNESWSTKLRECMDKLTAEKGANRWIPVEEKPEKIGYVELIDMKKLLRPMELQYWPGQDEAMCVFGNNHTHWRPITLPKGA